MSQGEGTVYVYGVLSSSHRAPVSTTGVEGSPVRTVDHNGLSALVSDLRGDALAAARELRAHWAVLEEASAQATVLPVRFGTVLEDEAAVRDRLLAPNADHLTSRLRALEGRVQLTVKGDYDEDRLLRGVIASSPAVAAMRERVRTLPAEAGYFERIRLGELVAAEVARRRELDTQLALEVLEPHAVAVHADDPRGPNGAFALAFLVERTGIDAFGGAVARLVEQTKDRLEIRYVGPLPPYSFTDADAGDRSPAWA
jgi:hypothetical protein